MARGPLAGIIYDHAKTHGLVACHPPHQNGANDENGSKGEFTFATGHLPIVHDVALRFFSFDAAVCPDY